MKLEPGSIGQLAVPLRNQTASKSNGSGVELCYREIAMKLSNRSGFKHSWAQT